MSSVEELINGKYFNLVLLLTKYECINSIYWVYNNTLLRPIMIVTKKREVADKNHAFPHLWTAEYFLICISATAVCIICNENTCSEKDYNIKRQCKTSHALQLSGIHSKMRSKKKTQLQNSLAQQQSLCSQHCSVC